MKLSLCLFFFCSQLICCSTPLTPQQQAAVNAGVVATSIALDFAANAHKIKPDEAAAGKALIGIAATAVTASSVGAVQGVTVAAP